MSSDDLDCPVCIEQFAHRRLRYNIACGHIFCLDCLAKISPRLCLMCRKAYSEGDITQAPVASLSGSELALFVLYIILFYFIDAHDGMAAKRISPRV
ncbi:hypothetical protein GGX14DRAFT_411009 [Mycena pura]|uniref:RING-type domain-containing protein n=1 Tax=Mycena pura TaxID=153505 RepID=A0AAD6YW98_9AGAR|nr:hypothetical protein GGX14DRAFT_411009 [Mycena pura]